MSEEGNKIKQPAQSDTPKAAPQPRIRDYLLAIMQMIWAGIRKHKKIVGIILLVIVVGFLAYRLATDRQNNPDLSTDALIITVSRQANISGDPNPAILTVIDKEKTNQPFLDESKNGDRVLLYYRAQKAVLYRPSDNKVIKVGAYTPPAAKIQIRQGTTDEKRVTAATDLLKKVTNTEIKTRDDSAVKNYAETIVINVTNRYDKEVEAVAKALGTTPRTPPQNETIPDADILVIVGAK
jgi:hypothetical protein